MKVLDLRKIRVEKKLSQEELADQSGITVRTIQRIENQESVPRTHTLNQLANALGVLVDELYSQEQFDHKPDDSNRIHLMKLSQFLFPIYLLGFLAPYIMKFSQKDPSDKFTSWSNEIINLQFTWALVFISTILFWVSGVVNVVWMIPLVYLSVKFQIFQNINFLKNKPTIQAIVVFSVYMLTSSVLGPLLIILLFVLNIYLIIQSISSKNPNEVNPTPLKLILVK